MEVTIVEVKTATVATVPADRTRTTIGVCEQVTLITNPSTNASWSAAHGGALSTNSGTRTIFTASDTASASTVTATFADGRKCDINFTVIVPTGVVMAIVPGSRKHIWGTASAGFLADITILPTTVSFGGIQIQEQQVNAVTTGAFNVFAGLPHSRGPWVDVDPNNYLVVQDQVFSGVLSPPFAPGTFLWAIPWNYCCAENGGTETQFAVINHSASTMATGAMTMSKAGASITCQPSDPTTTPF